MAKAVVLGAGAWGTALAIQLIRCGQSTCLWARDPRRACALQEQRENPDHLPGIVLPEALEVTADLEWALAGRQRVVVAVPSVALGALGQEMRAVLTPASWVVIATKGLEEESGQLMHEVLEVALHGSCLGGIAVLSGPSFALEVAQGMPTAVTLAHVEIDQAERIAGWFRDASMRVYSSDDPVGVELGGAIKNVIAIAAGISDGLGFGYNAKAALITRGLAELIRLGIALGGRLETLTGLAGTGDLVLTCTGALSRNRQLGELLGSGTPVEAIPERLWQRAEGVRTVKALRKRAKTLGVEMPITEQVYRVLYQGERPQSAVRSLMERPPKAEHPLSTSPGVPPE